MSGFGHVYNLEPKLAEKVKQAFFTFPWEGSALKAEYKEDDQFIPNDYRKDWAHPQDRRSARGQIHLQVRPGARARRK